MGINSEVSETLLSERISPDFQDHARQIVHRLEQDNTHQNDISLMQRMAVYSAFVDKTYPHTTEL